MIYLLYPINTYIAVIKKSIRREFISKINWNGEIFDHLESNSKEIDQYLS